MFYAIIQLKYNNKPVGLHMIFNLIAANNSITAFLDLHLDGIEEIIRMREISKPKKNLAILMLREVIEGLGAQKFPVFLTPSDMFRNLKALEFGIFAHHTREEKTYIALLRGFKKLYKTLNNKSPKQITPTEFLDSLTMLEKELKTAIATLEQKKPGSANASPTNFFESRNSTSKSSFDSVGISARSSFNITSVASTSSLDFHALLPSPEESSVIYSRPSVTWHPDVEDKVKAPKKRAPRPRCLF